MTNQLPFSEIYNADDQKRQTKRQRRITRRLNGTSGVPQHQPFNLKTKPRKT